MAIGMTYEQYWFGDALMSRDFQEAYQLRQQQQNEMLWLQGMYFYEGFCTALHNALASKVSKKVSYPEKPYEVFRGPKTEEEKKREIEEKRIKAYQYFDSIVRAAKEGRTVL